MIVQNAPTGVETEEDSVKDDKPQELPESLDEGATAFIENFATAWESMNSSRMEGRVLGLLIISDESYMSARRIGRLLHASAGAISTATRQLVAIGFVNQHTVPGDRRHFYRVEDDVWGAFLAGERDYLRKMSAVVRRGLQTPAGQHEGPRRRLVNADRYMTWLTGYHRKMLEDWQTYRDQIDNALGETTPDSEDSV
ncbi:GbsR/MarR family transcriptional regulator [Nesterenkonia muleiensis]|uniref:GbsR/MarR family transcriptional regulator n=1 Tax=Nesterenkonia muleiensis TaxID=2282648 RepID=UPI000E744530|nr:transcriptional regulator [Nesterenkonia muleiensis]